MTGSDLLTFVLGALVGVIMGGATFVQYLRQEVTADRGPRLQRRAGTPMSVLTAGLLCLPALVIMPGRTSHVNAPAVKDLTCFAIDVSGSNTVASAGQPPSDPGPVFVRQQVVELYSEILADLSQATDQQVGVVTFGTGIGTSIGPLPLSGSAGRSQLESGLPRALRPSPAEAAWTDWVAGVTGCQHMFERSGITSGMVVVLTDGYPQGPAGGPARQLAAISPAARELWAEGIAIQPVLYGAGAGQPGPARQAMTQLAAMGHGQLVLAATPLDMMRSALALASRATGLPLGGSEVSVNGSSGVPLDVTGQVDAAVLVVLRSSSEVQIAVALPGQKPLASAGAGTPSLGLVVALTRPAAGTYEASADGQGSVFAAELLRYAPVTAPSPGPSGHPRRISPHGAAGASLTWALVGGLGGLGLLVLSGWFIASRRRPKGTLVVWCGPLYRVLAPVDVSGLVKLEDLCPLAAGPAGWYVGWTRPSPTVLDPDGETVQLAAGETKTVHTTPPITFTWFPGGTDTSLSAEPPGRPASTVP
jgi:hypothetical protein